MWAWDAQWVALFQQAVMGWTGFWKTVTFLGEETFYLVAFPLIYWCLSAPLGLRAGVLLLFSAQANAALKLLFHQPRPFWVFPSVQGLAEGTSFGVPSGHAQLSAAVWGRLAWPLGRRGRAAAALLVVLIGLSRIALGVHFWTDVLVGWLLGGVTLAVALVWEPRLKAWVHRAGPWRVLAAAAGVSAVWIALAVMARSFGMAATPPAWAEAWSLKGVVGTGGAWLGLVAGALWMHNRFSASGAWWRRVLRAGLGLVGVVLLWAGLRAVLPAGEDAVALMARFLRYGLVGFWVTGAAPWVFQRLGLQPADA